MSSTFNKTTVHDLPARAEPARAPNNVSEFLQSPLQSQGQRNLASPRYFDTTLLCGEPRVFKFSELRTLKIDLTPTVH